MRSFPLKKYIIIILILFSQVLSAELLHKFSFQNNLDSDDGTHTLEYIDLEEGQVTFHNQLNGRAVKFLPNNGTQIPNSVFADSDFNSSIEITFTVKLTDMGSDTVSGKKTFFKIGGTGLLNLGLIVNQIGFSGQPSSSSNAYTFGFVAGDGNGGRETFNLGKLFLDDEVKVKFIIDFANRSFKLFANQLFFQRQVADDFDMENFSTMFDKEEIYFGWQRNQETVYNSGQNKLATGFFDDLAIYSPAQPKNLSALKTAAENLTGHINGSSVLNQASFNENMFNLFSNYDKSFRFGQARGKLLNLLSAFEDNYPPLFELDDQGNRMSYRNGEFPPEQFLMMNLHQIILDEDVTSTNAASIQGLRFRLADDFSGLANPVAPRLNSFPVEINGNYKEDPEIVNSFYGVPAKRPTGLYAAPGEIITITVPNELVEAGLKVIVGAHTADLYIKSKFNRYLRVSRTFDINDTEIQVISPLGGGIYITVPHESKLGWITLIVSGAVKSPYFSYRQGRITPIDQWRDELSMGNSLWVDLESDKYMMTVPANSFLEDNIDPAELMSKWDRVMDGYRYISGRPLQRARAEYGIADTIGKGNGGTIGYPQTYGLENVPFVPIGSGEERFLPISMLDDRFWDYNGIPMRLHLHEMGHASQINLMGPEKETIVDVFGVYVANALYGAELGDAFFRMVVQKLTIENGALDWMIDDRFRAGENMTANESKYQARGSAKYVEFVEFFGWDALSETHRLNWQQALIEHEDSSDYVVPIDVYTQHLSEASGYNMAPLMHFWGFKPSDEKIEELSSMPRYYPYLERLNFYQDSIHTDLAAFQEWHSNTFGSIDSRYARHFEEFDDLGYRQAMINQVKAIKALYYPEADLIFSDGFEG